MKKHLLLLFIVFTNFLNAQNFKNAYEQLVSVNQQWENIKDVNPTLKLTPAKQLNEQQLIQFHLQQVELLLRKRNTNHLSASQQKQRKHNLNILHSYLQQAVFPINDLHANRQPYFIDKYNTYCAVGYLMKMTGADKMAKEINATQKFSYLLDIQHPQLMSWVEHSGLTLNELALIQPGYGGEVPAILTEMHYNNAGLDVNEYIEIRQSTGQLIGLPNFDSLIFADATGVVYKRLPISSMIAASNNSLYHYTFPSGESFADAGSVLIKRNYTFISQDSISLITYNSSTVTVKRFTSNSTATTTYTIGESESTAIGSSLGFIGTYGTVSWNLVAGSNSMAAINPGALFPTPVSLSKFDYALKNKKVTLSWETVSEINNSHFLIEKSIDGTNFQTIGKVVGAGTSNSIKQYSFTDDNPLYINQYRLKQIDVDGKYNYSKILFVKVTQANPLSIINNPVKNTLQYSVDIQNPNETNTIVVYDMMGKRLKKYAVQLGLQKMNIGDLKNGQYLIQLTTNSQQTFSQLFIKAD